MKHVVINIFGRVQMEGFRYIVLRNARKLNIKGFVKNLRDGSVEIEAQGEAASIDDFIEWCRIGPPYADIGKVIVEEMKTSNLFEEFIML